MTDLRQALADIDAIRSQVARSTQFRGYGPRSTAMSGLLAIAVASMQASWLSTSERSSGMFVSIWVVTAAVALGISAWETITRARRMHEGCAREMMHAAVEQVTPALAAGMLLTAVLLRIAPQAAWMLPGLWSLIFSLGIFASCRFLPRPMFAAGVWYLAAGLICLSLENGAHSISAWTMGVPFGVGQLLVAAVLKFGYGDAFEAEE